MTDPPTKPVEDSAELNKYWPVLQIKLFEMYVFGKGLLQGL